MSPETGYSQHYGDSEREGKPPPAQCGHEAEEKSHQADRRHDGGDQFVPSVPGRGVPEDQYPGEPAEPACDRAEDDQPRRPGIPAAAARGRGARLGGDGGGVANSGQEGPDACCVVRIELGPPFFMCSCT
jgi:hypothetical protein